MFKFDEIEKEEREKKVQRDCRTRVAKLHIAAFASELERMIEPMRIYFPTAEVRIADSGLAVTLDLKYRTVQGEQQIFWLGVKVEHDSYMTEPDRTGGHGFPSVAILKDSFYRRYGERIEGLFRMRMLQSLEDD